MTARTTSRPAVGQEPPPVPGHAFGLVDELSCYFDTPAEPSNVHLEAWLPGRLDAERLRTGVAAMLACQPRARARRVAGGWRRRGYAWEFPPEADLDPVSVTYWRTEAELDAARARFLATAPPLDRSPPFRLLLASGPGQDALILNAHHAAFDGRSCLLLLRLIADQYGGGPPSGPSAADRAGLPRRPPARRTRRSARIAPQRSARIAPQRGTGRWPRRAPGYGFVLLAWPGVPATPQPENRPRITVNDLLIAALIQAIARWNAARRRRPGTIRITMPVDTRRPGSGVRGGELGNLSRLTTVTAEPESLGADFGSADLAAVVAGQTTLAKQQPGPPVGPPLAVARAPLPTLVKRRLVRLGLRCLGRLQCDTSLLSNLGNVTEAFWFGPLSPARIWFSTSAHMPRGLSVGAITIEGRLQLCFRYRRALLDDAAARDFAGEYAAALGAVTGTGAGR